MTHRIAFVPGILGSELHDPGLTPGILWPGLRLVVSVQELAWSPNDTIIPTRPVTCAYRDIIADLRTLAAVVECPYDWRGRIATSAGHVAATLDEALDENDTLAIVTHSMGGLVLLRALALLDDDERSRITNIIFTCPPFFGSLEPLRWYTSDNDRSIQLAELILDAHGASMKGILASWTGFFEMLIAPRELWPGDSPPMSRQADIYRCQEHVTLSSVLLDHVIASHVETQEHLAALMSGFEGRVGVLVAVDGATPLRAHIRNSGFAFTRSRVSGDGAPFGSGDGTVPLASSIIPGMPLGSLVALPAAALGQGDNPHPMVFQSPLFRRTTLELLRGDPPSSPLALVGPAVLAAVPTVFD